MSETERACPSCGRSVLASLPACPYCGQDLASAGESQPQQTSVPEGTAPELPDPWIASAPRGGRLPTFNPSDVPAISMDGVLAEVASALSRWLDREPESREQRAAQVIDLIERDALLPRGAGKKAALRMPWLLRTPLIPWIVVLLLLAGARFLWQDMTRKSSEAAAARSDAAQARSDLDGSQQQLQGAQATVAFQETAIAYDAGRILGPMDGELLHDRDLYLESFPLTVDLMDFDLSVRFDTPYDGATKDWDFGIVFRNVGGSGSYRLDVLSTGIWKLTYGALPGLLASGTVDNLNIGANMQNTLLLQVRGGRATFTVNDVQVGSLDVSAHQDVGTISPAIGIWQGNEQAGATTRFEDLSIWQAP